MINISFYGASENTSGQCFQFQTSNNRFLIDCGLFLTNSQDQDDILNTRLRNKHFRFDPSRFDFVLLSHSHIDHSGNLPNLVRQGFHGKIFLTKTTANQLEELFTKLIQRYGFDLYTIEDIRKTTDLYSYVSYETKTYLNDKLAFEFYDSNHIPGSASIKIFLEEKKIWVSGDFGKEPTYPTDIDYLIMESTFGDGVITNGNHAKQDILLKYAMSENKKLKMIFLVHASLLSASILKSKLGKRKITHIPMMYSQITI